MAKLQPNSLWLLKFVIDTEDRLGLGTGYCVHLAMPCDAPPGLSMQTMRGLEKRGLVEEFMSGGFRATALGRTIAEANG